MGRKQPTPPPSKDTRDGHVAEASRCYEEIALRRRDVLDVILRPVRIALMVVFIAVGVFGGIYLIDGSAPDALALGVWSISVVLAFQMARPR